MMEFLIMDFILPQELVGLMVLKNPVGKHTYISLIDWLKHYVKCQNTFV